MLPRTKYNFSIYLDNVKKIAARLKTLCEAGHIAEQKHIAKSIESLDFGLGMLQSVTDSLRIEVHSLKRQLQITSLGMLLGLLEPSHRKRLASLIFSIV